MKEYIDLVEHLNDVLIARKIVDAYFTFLTDGSCYEISLNGEVSLLDCENEVCFDLTPREIVLKHLQEKIKKMQEIYDAIST